MPSWIGIDELRAGIMSLALAGCLALVAPALPRQANWARASLAVLVLLVSARYLWWRLVDTVLPVPSGSGQWLWIWFCFVIEAGAFIEVAVFMLIMSRLKDRTPEADQHERALRAQPPNLLPSVDVLIPTFNEGMEVLEKTIVGALGLDYPRFFVTVLDDGRRDWLRDFCARKGVRYVTRPDNAHAKAGNLNNAYRQTSADLIAIFDADFVPRRDFLWRTAGFFADPTIGIVQTPQHFFNRDPIQLNLMLGQKWPDEQRLYFDVMAPGRDAWDAAFCCGSCSIIRRQALDEIGGFPTSSITEDLLTTLAMLRKGYITRYLNEPLSMGLAAESIEAYFIQRERWCHGGVQSIYVKEGPLGRGMSWLQRVLFFPFSWVVQYPVRVLAMVIPAVYMWTELTPLLFTSVADIVAYQIPVFVAYFGAMYWFAPQRYIPLVNTTTAVFTAFRLIPVVISSLLRPFSKPFHVTPKGHRKDGTQIDVVTLSIAGVIFAATVGGMAVNMVPGWAILRDEQFFPVAAFWGTINLFILFLVGLICFEAPRWRSEERFALDEATHLVTDGTRLPCRVIDASLTGALLDWPKDQTPPADGAAAQLALREVGAVPATVVRVRGWGTRVALRFAAADGSVRDRLIRRLFTTGLSNAVEGVTTAGVAAGLWQRAFGR
jgi:cellulose synthase (UDP-forming)